ncbi:hypothetical protein KTN05_02460 [Paracoccus sp. Z118]|uniref:hypothetical protein n=1 Tax=Paracoccus sp. Z118 TaxID=2851017 RepID=UPI001C2B9618|nr:hypothetical protein [Paracoccus sp. Z118]MBV0890712.1 hypothetical protein [Paracoccus sp. Z118]
MSTLAFRHHPAWLEWGWADPETRPVPPLGILPVPGTAVGVITEAEVFMPRHGRSLRLWWLHHREHAAERRSVRLIPEHLRHDLGLNGDLPPAHFENDGRTFVSGDRPDCTLSGWLW